MSSPFCTAGKLMCNQEANTWSNKYQGRPGPPGLELQLEWRAGAPEGRTTKHVETQLTTYLGFL